MPKSALPPHLDDKEEIERAFPDDSENGPFIRRLKKATKTWFAFGPRAVEKWAKWREFPKTLFAIRSSQGIFRIETEGWEKDSAWDSAYDERAIFMQNLWSYREWQGSDRIIEYTPGYLSRVQYYTRWSFQLQWPFLVAFHFYPRAKDVPEWGKPRPETDGKLWFFYLGAHRDADKVYWFPSAYLGKNWK